MSNAPPSATHFLILGHPPRATFMRDMTAEERATMLAHQAFLREQMAAGKLLLAGPSLDGAFGVAIYKVTSAEEMRAIQDRDPAKGLFAKIDMHPLLVGMLAP